MGNFGLVYLCGGITGLNYSEAIDWRTIVSEELNELGIRTISPMRGKEELSYVKRFSGHAFSQDKHPIATPQAIVRRDLYDLHRCDIVLANLLGYTKTPQKIVEDVLEYLEEIQDNWKKPTLTIVVDKAPISLYGEDLIKIIRSITLSSIGSISEIAWAFKAQKPVVLIMEEKGNIHEHAFIHQMISHRAYNLESGLELVKQILLD